MLRRTFDTTNPGVETPDPGDPRPAIRGSPGTAVAPHEHLRLESLAGVYLISAQPNGTTKVREAAGPAGAGEACPEPVLGASAEVAVGVRLGADFGADESRNEPGGFGGAVGATRVTCRAVAPILDAVTEVRVDHETSDRPGRARSVRKRGAYRTPACSVVIAMNSTSPRRTTGPKTRPTHSQFTLVLIRGNPVCEPGPGYLDRGPPHPATAQTAIGGQREAAGERHRG